MAINSDYEKESEEKGGLREKAVIEVRPLKQSKERIRSYLLGGYWGDERESHVAEEAAPSGWRLIKLSVSYLIPKEETTVLYRNTYNIPNPLFEVLIPYEPSLGWLVSW